MSKFERDLEQGKIYERKAVEYFDYDSYKMKKGYCKEYDFHFVKDGIKKYVEVKSDRLASVTGNLCIEYMCNDKPSGITSTTADYWVYFILHTKGGGVKGEIIKEEVYKIPTDELRNIVKGCRRVSGGDWNKSRLYLVSKHKVRQYLVKLHNEDSEDDADDGNDNGDLSNIINELCELSI